MTRLTDRLLTHSPQRFDFAGKVALPEDPVAWGLGMIRENRPEAAMQMRETPDSEEVTYLDEQEEKGAFAEFGE